MARFSSALVVLSGSLVKVEFPFLLRLSPTALVLLELPDLLVDEVEEVPEPNLDVVADLVFVAGFGLVTDRVVGFLFERVGALFIVLG